MRTLLFLACVLGIVSATPFASFLTYFYDGCNTTTNNYVYDLYLYPADGSCFVPSGGWYFPTYLGYRISSNASTVTVSSYQALNCSGVIYEENYYPINTCYQDLYVQIYPTLPTLQYWANQQYIGYDQYYWETIQVTNYYSLANCANNTIVSVAVSGYQSCLNGNYLYCQNGQLHADTCVDLSCAAGCSQLRNPLNNTCSASVNVPAGWSSYIDYSTSAGYEATCVQAVLPSPSPTPVVSATPTPYRSPSASPSPAPYTSYAGFTAWYNSGCNQTSDNYIYDLYLYPADGSCFVPAGGYLIQMGAAYRITYNQTTVSFAQYDINCTTLVKTDYYPRDSCYYDTVATIYPSMPSPQYWTTLGLAGYGQEPWDTILVTNYYSNQGCQGSSLNSVQIQGWPACEYGDTYFCENGQIHMEYCQDNVNCNTGCEEYYGALDNSCTSSENVPEYWDKYLDYFTSVSYQATCVGVKVPPSPSPTPTTTPLRPVSPSPSPAAVRPYAGFFSYYYAGCNVTWNYLWEAYLFPADGSCFTPSGGYVLSSWYYYRITYNTSFIQVNQYENCSSELIQTFNYPRDNCDGNLFSTIYSSLPSADYWSTAPQINWETILVTNYYSDLGCYGSQLTSVQILGWDECEYDYYYHYCKDGFAYYEVCSGSEYCTSNCSTAYDPLNNACTVTTDQPYGWSWELDQNAEAYQSTCIGGTPIPPSAAPSVSPTPYRSPSVSATPAPFTSYAAFTTWDYNGCNDTSYNFVYDLYLYPADGSCFRPSGGWQMSSSDGYQITYNQTHVRVLRYDSADCTGAPFSSYAYEIGGCTLDCSVTIYSSPPSEQYWIDQEIKGQDGTWETVLVTNYYSKNACDRSSLISIQVQGWPQCDYGMFYYCQDDKIAADWCYDTVSCDPYDSCYAMYYPLDDSCTDSAAAPYSAWNSYLDLYASTSFQASCAQSSIPTSPTPTASPIPTSGPYVSFMTYAKYGCSSTSNNWVNDLYLYPADGNCFLPSGGYQFHTSYQIGYRIAVNSTTVSVLEYSESWCENLNYVYYYPLDSCAYNSNVMVSYYPWLPDNNYWVDLGIVGAGNQVWETVVVTNYYSAILCEDDTVGSIQVQGWPECNAGVYYYCQDGEAYYEVCSSTDCSTGCTRYYDPLETECSPSIGAPAFWSDYLDWGTSVSFQASCVGGVPLNSGSNLEASGVLIAATLMLLIQFISQ